MLMEGVPRAKCELALAPEDHSAGPWMEKITRRGGGISVAGEETPPSEVSLSQQRSVSQTVISHYRKAIKGITREKGPRVRLAAPTRACDLLTSAGHMTVQLHPGPSPARDDDDDDDDDETIRTPPA